MRLLALSYGVLPIYLEEKVNAQAYFFSALELLLKEGRLAESDMVAYLSGSFGEGGGTSFLEINKVKTVLSKAKDYLIPSFVER